MTHKTETSPSLDDVSTRIQDASADMDALQGHLLHISTLASPPDGAGDRDMAQTCYHLANSISAIKATIDAAVSDLTRLQGVRS